MTEEPLKVLVGVFPIAKDATIPHELLERASAELDAERARRRRVAEAAQAAAERAAARKSWRGRLRAFFGRGP